MIESIDVGGATPAPAFFSTTAQVIPLFFLILAFEFRSQRFDFLPERFGFRSLSAIFVIAILSWGELCALWGTWTTPQTDASFYRALGINVFYSMVLGAAAVLLPTLISTSTKPQRAGKIAAAAWSAFAFGYIFGIVSQRFGFYLSP
jgi:hypothetical protein